MYNDYDTLFQKNNNQGSPNLKTDKINLLELQRGKP